MDSLNLLWIGANTIRDPRPLRIRRGLGVDLRIFCATLKCDCEWISAGPLRLFLDTSSFND